MMLATKETNGDCRKDRRRESSGYLNVCVRRVDSRPFSYKSRHSCQEQSAGEEPGLKIAFRPYQLPVFQDRSTGILVLHWRVFRN